MSELATLVERYGGYCRALFDELPVSELASLVGSGALADTDLTFAAETLGQRADRPTAVSALLPLLAHRSALVREGVLYGLGRHAEGYEPVLYAIAQVAESDKSPAVRQAALDMIPEEVS